MAWSGLFDDVFSDGPHSLQHNRPSARRKLARLMRKRGMKTLQELMLTLTGATVGSAAAASYSRVEHDADQLGGVRTIETVTQVSRNTTAADETDIETNVLQGAAALDPSAYPTEKSGNSGGGRLGF